MAGKQKDNVLCLDIGGDSIKAAEFSFSSDGSLTLQKFSFEECDFGDISTDSPEFVTAMNDKIRTLILAEGYRTKSANVSISGQNAFIRFDKIPAMTDDMDKIQQILDFEAKQNLPFPVDDVVYSTQLLRADEEDELDAMFVVTKKSEVVNVIKNLESIQKRVNLVEVAPTAIYNAAHFNGVGENQCEMILNIGGRCSTLIFVDNGKYFIRSFLTAGHAITQQISKEFQIPYKDAEEMKRRHGFVGLGGAYEEPESEVAATVSKIIRNVMTRLHGEIFRTINVYRTQQKGRKPEKMYLTGGSSVMAYTPRFFQEKLHIPVEYLNAFQSVGVAQDVDREKLSSVAHLFPEVVGLAMREAFVCPVSVALIPMDRKKIEMFQKRKPFLYASCVALIFCLVLSYRVLLTRLVSESDLDEIAQLKWKKTEEVQTKIQKNFKELTDRKSDYEEASAFFNGSEYWAKLLRAIQRITPAEGVWYTAIYATPSLSDAAAAVSVSPGMENSGEFNGFDEAPKSKEQKQKSADLSWLVLRGHIWTKNKDDSRAVQKIYSKLLDGLRTLELDPVQVPVDKSGKKAEPKKPLFEKITQQDINRMEQKFSPAPSGCNISTFCFEIKLKEPIKR